MLTATELIKRSILGTSGFLEVQCRMLSATELTKGCILAIQGLFRGVFSVSSGFLKVHG